VTAIKLEILIDPKLPPVVPGAVSFETGSETLALHVYGPGRVGPLLAFYEDLISGAPMPLVFATKRVSGPHTVLAATLFFDRYLAIHPATPGVVYSVDAASRLGDTIFGHLEPSLSRFLRGVALYFQPSMSRQEAGQRLATAMGWMRSYLVDGTLPSLGPVIPSIRVLDTGTNGFVLASSPRPGPEAWESLYRDGYLRGILIGDEESQGLRYVLAARKSFQVGFDLERLTPILNELEQLSGGMPSWSILGNYLASPPDGSTISLQYLVEVFLRG